FDTAVRTCDNHVVYRNAAKEIAAHHGRSLTFMAKFDEREGSSCHIHLSLRGVDGEAVFADEARPNGHSVLFEHFLAGILATQRELTYFYAPNINSYKRFASGSFAPTTVAWGRDNRTCALRVVGHGPALRVENRVGGGDLNPYLAVAAMLAGGLHGIENELPLEPALEGNAYTCDKPRVPSTLQEARDLLAASSIARGALGDEVVDHYVNAADVEITAFNAAVTDWERRRGFERL
ncbi:MAG TPA: glutamine synthetase, partial [Terrabacter sp.]|nr:glutamine synthetase [Terrabacter sp.]